MAKLKSFNVTFTNTNGVCFAGRELGGAIVLDVASKYKMKELRLRFRGYALVHWTERHSNGQGKSKRTVTKHYSGEELYFDHTVVLFASSGNQYETIAEGQHKFPFEFQVPSSCPTSYEGTCGRVRYEAVATIERMFGVGHSTISGFTVISHIDLNEDPRVRIVKYNAVKKVRTHCNIIASITKNDFASAGSKLVTWSGDKLVVPVVPPSFVSGCHIIDISYVLELIVNPAGPSFNLPVKMEVIVGTKPLRISNIPHSQIPDPIGIEEEKYLEKNRAPPSQKRRSLDHPNAGKSMDELCTKDNEPASTFEECILGAADLVDDEEYEEIPGPVTFTPMYPHYSFTGTQSPFDSGLKKQ
ncbi:uncharacterized protein LOC110445710 isoform X2 [Mizuhopecten yessoensis]|uniref:uncharacterized protein LOC110445710 isoform X2 n=1 Tax=Mizuhopecten yessoensis TaxID=6573 RepID=UPI000B458C4F|nr:uncharacterized protein LOC110445710 isoform X2 [Mizuhopecten yessoensis]